MFWRLTMAVFRLYMKYLVSSYMGLLWAVYSGTVQEVRWAQGGWEVWVHGVSTTII